MLRFVTVTAFVIALCLFVSAFAFAALADTAVHADSREAFILLFYAVQVGAIILMVLVHCIGDSAAYAHEKRARERAARVSRRARYSPSAKRVTRF